LRQNCAATQCNTGNNGSSPTHLGRYPLRGLRPTRLFAQRTGDAHTASHLQWAQNKAISQWPPQSRDRARRQQSAAQPPHRSGDGHGICRRTPTGGHIVPPLIARKAQCSRTFQSKSPGTQKGWAFSEEVRGGPVGPAISQPA
jgi:hypothetical protein